MLKLSLNLFCDFLKYRTKEFFLFTLGIFVTVLGMVFIFSRGMYAYRETASDYQETKTMAFEIEEKLEKSTKETLYEFLEKERSSIAHIIVTEFGADVIGYFAEENQTFSIPFGRYFSETEQDGAYVVLVSDGYLAAEPMEQMQNLLGQKILIKEAEYQVIGWYHGGLKSSSSAEIMIPLKTYIKEDFQMNQMQIILENQYSQTLYLDICHFLEKEGITYRSVAPKKFEKEAVAVFFQETASHFLILSICYLTLFQLLQYWLEANRKKFYVYFISGASRKTLFLLLQLHLFYLCFLPVVFGMICYKGIEKQFYQIQFTAKLDIVWCVGIGMAAIGLTMVAAVYGIWKYVKNL